VTCLELRQELSKRLAAFRNIHNYNYLHDRASGTPDLINASHLLRVETIDYLLKYKDEETGIKIATQLRNLEALAQKRKIKKKELKDLLDRKEKEGREELEKIIKALEKDIDDKLNSESWNELVAGYLFKGLEEAARYDIDTGAAGDFFLGRIFNSRERARGDWGDEKWGRNVNFMEIADACDLGKDSFVIEHLKKLKKKKGEEALVKLGVVGDDLSEAEFEKMFSLDYLEDISIAPDNALTRQRLEIDDAENVRKLLFNPGGLLQKPNLSILGEINKVFKHLKEEKRYRWYRRMATAIIEYYKDNRYPFWDGAPEKARKSRSRKDFPHIIPWTARQIKDSVESMAPLLRKEDMDKVLEGTLGKSWEAKMISKDIGAAVAKGVGTSVWEMIKGALGL